MHVVRPPENVIPPENERELMRNAQESMRLLELPDRALKLPRTPRILILALAHLGDFLLSLRAMRSIRECFKGANITIVCAPWCVEWAKKFGSFDRIVPFAFFTELNRDWTGSSPELLARFARLELGHFDIAIDMRHDPDTRPCLYRVSSIFRAGFAAPVEDGLPHLDVMLPSVENMIVPGSDVRRSLHAETRLQLLASAVVCVFAQEEGHPVEKLVSQSSSSRSGRRQAVLAISAGDPIRCWSADRFAELGCALVHMYNFDIIVLGGRAELIEVNELVAQLPSGRAVAKTNISLSDLPSHIATAELFVGHGTGVSHLAAVLGVPTIALLTGVSPLDVWRPVGPRTVVLTNHVPCSPCGFKYPKQCAFDVKCLSEISTRDVLKAIADLIGEPSSAVGARPLAGLSQWQEGVRRAGQQVVEGAVSA
jgi:ADP-heptose:LPS heptosyltransferase